MSHHREPVTAPGAPEAAGPYVHAVRAGGLLFCSMQIPLDPEGGELVGDDAPAQLRRCLDNLQAVVDAAGASLVDDAVRLTVYATDMSAFAPVNEAYAAFFGHSPPARSAIGVTALPRGAQVAVDAVVAIP